MDVAFTIKVSTTTPDENVKDEFTALGEVERSTVMGLGFIKLVESEVVNPMKKMAPDHIVSLELVQ